MNGPCHRSKTSQDAWHERASWLPVIWLARYSPELHRKEREWRYLKRDARGPLARTLRAVADGILAGLRRLGGHAQRRGRSGPRLVPGRPSPPPDGAASGAAQGRLGLLQAGALSQAQEGRAAARGRVT